MANFFSAEEYQCIMKNALDTPHFKLLEIKEKPLSAGESGLLGEHVKIEATVFQESSSKQIKLHYFGKVKPRDEGIHRDLVNSSRAFEKESKFYSTLFHHLKKQHFEVQNFRKHIINFWSCICYFSHEDMIILEDLSVCGFKTHGTRNPLDFNHCAIVLKTLACLHVASIAYEEKELVTDGQNIKELHPDIFFETICVKEKNHLGYILCNTAQKAMISLCEYLPNFGNSHKHYEYIRKELMETSSQLYDLVKPSHKFRNVVCHGDLWTNNIMFKYGSTGEPEEVRFIDFQLVRYCPPAHDIMLFLHLTTTRTFRQNHLDQLLELYYTAFSEELALHHLQAENLMSWTELCASCDEYSTIGLIFASMYFQNNLLNNDKIKEVIADKDKFKKIFFQDKSDFLINAYLNDPIFRERISEATEELIERCVLSKIK